MKGLLEAIRDRALQKRRTVAIGALKDSGRLRDSLASGSRFADVIVVGAAVPGYEYVSAVGTDQALSDKLVDLAVTERVDGIVRGQFDYSVYHNSLRRAFGLRRDLMCVCLLRDMRGDEWLIAPAVHHDDATIGGRTYLASQAARICSALSVEPKVAVLAADGERGYMAAIDKSLDDAEAIAANLTLQGTSAAVYPLRIDQATRDCNIVVPMDGILGNFLHRALGYLGGATLGGCLSLSPRLISLDTSRFNDAFALPIEIAVAMTNLGGMPVVEYGAQLT